MFSYDIIHYNQRRFASSLPNYNFIFKVAAEECLASLSQLNLHPSSILVLGHFPLLKQLYTLHPQALVDYRDGFHPDLKLTQTYDIIISIGQLQWHNNPIGYLNALHTALTSKGAVYVIFPGENSLKELHTALVNAEILLTQKASQRVIPMISASDALRLMQTAQFTNPLVHVTSIELQHDSIFDLMQDVRNMGASNPMTDRATSIPPKKLFSLADSSLKKRQAFIKSSIDLVAMVGRK